MPASCATPRRLGFQTAFYRGFGTSGSLVLRRMGSARYNRFPEDIPAVPTMPDSAETLYCQAEQLLARDPADHEGAAELLRRAAGAGHDGAACALLQLRETAGEPFSALAGGYTALAERGVLAAQLRLLEHYAAQHHPDAVVWAQRAADQNHPLAQYYLAQHLQNAAEPDTAAAERLLRQAAAQDLPLAHWQLGRQYLGGGLPQHRTQAAAHLRKAAEAGILPAQTALAELLQEDGDCEALAWYQSAAEQGDNHARAALAQLYLTGTLCGRDAQAARQYAAPAAEAGHPEALRLMGDILRYGLGVEADPDAALNCYRRAADAGSISAYRKLLGDAALKREDSTYSQTKSAALFMQQTQALYREAEQFRHGTGRLKNPAKARLLYLEAAEFHHAPSMCALGEMYCLGQGLKRDFAQAAHWLSLAAEQGEPAAQYLLAHLYYGGQGLPQSTHAACRLMAAALDNGYAFPDDARRILAQWREELPHDDGGGAEYG